MNRSLEESRGTDFFGILNVGGDYRYCADFLSESDNFLEGSRRLPSRTELHLERRHSSPCHAAFLPGTGLSATTSVMILTACSAAVSTSSRPGVMTLNLVMVELRAYPKMRCLMLERTLLV